MRLRARARAFWKLPRRGRADLVEATVVLAVAKGAIRLLPFKKIASRMGDHMEESPPTASTADQATAARISWAVEKAARHVPVEANCLPQAITAVLMLRRRGVPCTLYMGVLGVEHMRAHAWVRAGELIVTGRRGRQGYTVVSTFA